ncbi:MAG: DUF72 domain-containing protein [Candidatus Bathyarchaeota archaeon]|nr:DUF72 domain-containing protein [Candidatus Bathyarchaeota archaeon]
MEFYVGTSGWAYSWNEDGNFDWYVRNSGLNAVELNASFYRFPFPNMVWSWVLKGKGFRWSVKVNRLITHTFKFNDRAFQLWIKFRNLFAPLEQSIDFFLFQLPPSMTPKSAPLIQGFFEKTKLKERFAIEVRNLKWFNKEWVDWCSGLGITWVSVDSPDFPTEVFNTNGLVYERMHGRTEWYAHFYTDEELWEVADKILKVKPKRAYVFFNNDHAMLENSQKMLSILREVKE